MNQRGGALARLARRWVRPLLLPPVRACIRYAPNGWAREQLWAHVVAPWFQYSNTEFVTDTVFGATIAGNTRDFIQRHIFYFGVWEPNLTAFVSRRLRAGDVFVDVGANIGYFSLLASTLVGPTGRVIAIEASPTTFAALSANVARNRAGNVVATNTAVSDRQGTVQVFAADRSNIGATSISSRGGSRYEADVPADTLDALLARLDAANPRFVKIDVEGAEWLVIAGMLGVLSNASPALEIAVELMPDALASYGRTVDDVFALFASHGFWPYRIENDYSVLGYISRRDITPPVRVRTPVVQQTDLVFSRVDAERL